jgi:hypothetical protein
MQTTRNGLLAGAAAAILLAGLSGCSGNNVAKELAAMNTSNVHRVANMYSGFQNYKNGRGPNDEAEFKQFIKEFDPEKLSMMGIDKNNVDKLFTSEWDGKPFKIRYKIGGGRGSVAAVVFDQEGKNGKKRVGFTGNARVDEVDDATYASLWAGQGESAAPAAPPAGAPSGGRPSGLPPGAPTGPPPGK